jgi:hypothetical protein
MATIIDQVTLRTGVADWLNRSDLTDSQIDDFVAIGEARIYEELRIPTLEVVQSFTVTSSNSSIILPAGFIEVIELKLDGGADKDDDIVLSRVDSKTFSNNKIKNAYTRQAGNFLLTDNEGNQDTGGTYVMTYYKAEDPIGTYATATTAAGAFVVGKYYKIAVAGNTTWTNHGSANNNVGTIFKATSQVSGTGTAYVENIPWILGTEFEATLYATCQVASIYLGDVEMEAKFDALTQRKIDALNQKEIRASMKGSAFSAQFSTPLL